MGSNTSPAILDLSELTDTSKYVHAPNVYVIGKYTCLLYVVQAY
jgi:hypothetical protein